MDNVSFLQDLAVVMLIAGLVTLLFRRLKQPVALGYIIAGVIIGPHTPPFPLINDEQTIRTLAELGMIFLMFSIGLEFNLRRLWKVGLPAAITAIVEIVVMIWLGYELGKIFGWNAVDSLFLGAMISISSTIIVVKALLDLKRMKGEASDLIFGILIVQDIAAVVMIALLSSISISGSFQTGTLIITMGRVLIFMASALILGLLIFPHVLHYVSRSKSDEMLLIAVLGLCFGTALVAAKLGYSVAMGAFIVGAIVAETRESGRVLSLTTPLRDVFSAVFFVAIGLMVSPSFFIKAAGPIAVITLLAVGGKIVTCSLGTFLTGHDVRTSLRVGMGLAPIGEFSFVIAALGLTLGVTGDVLYQTAVPVCAITAFLMPYLLGSADKAADLFERVAPAKVKGYMNIYGEWAERIWKGRASGALRKAVRRSAWIIAFNLALIASAFFVSAFLAPKFPIPGTAPWISTTIYWLGAMIIGLPFYFATFRKLRALSLLFGEMSVIAAPAGTVSAAIRVIVANTIFLAFAAGIGLLTLLLSSAILPPLHILPASLLVVVILAILLRKPFVNLYARAQVAIESRFARPIEVEEDGHPAPVPLLEVKTVVFQVRSGTGPAGKLIRETALREETGASIVCIERQGAKIVNPSPDEEIQPFDRLLLIGSPEQLDKARRHLSASNP